MDCISKISIRDPTGRTSAQRITVPCGRCLPCLQKKRVDWSFRLEQEYKICTSALFITLTYSEDYICYGQSEPSLVKDEISQFVKKLRNKERSNKSIKYYGVGEYGSQTDRPHYHIILFNLENKKNIENAWEKGHIHIGQVTGASIQYVTKYVITKNKTHKEKQAEFAVMSKNIGLNYVKTHGDYHGETDRQTVQMSNGSKIGIPRYIKDKVLSKYDKQMYGIKLQKQLDKADLEYNKHLEKLGIKNIEKYKIEQINNYINKANAKNSKNGNI